jgi:hypothetical protein
MKLALLSDDAFWGLVLVIFGISFLLKYVLHIQFPLLRLLLSTFLIYIGIALLITTPKSCISKNSGLSVNSGLIFSQNNQKISVAFTRCVIDARNLDETQGNEFKIDIFCGDCILRVNKGQRVKIIADSFFGDLSLPNNKFPQNSNYTYLSSGLIENESFKIITVDNTFGHLTILE